MAAQVDAACADAVRSVVPHVSRLLCGGGSNGSPGPFTLALARLGPPHLVLSAVVLVALLLAVWAAVRVRNLMPSIIRLPITLALSWIMAALTVVSARAVSMAAFPSGGHCVASFHGGAEGLISNVCAVVHDGSSVTAAAVLQTWAPPGTLADSLASLLGSVAPSMSLEAFRILLGIAAFFAVPLAVNLWRYFGASVFALFVVRFVSSMGPALGPRGALEAALRYINMDVLCSWDAARAAVSLLLLPEKRFASAVILAAHAYAPRMPLLLAVLAGLLFLAYRAISWADPFVMDGAARGIAWHLATVGAVVIVREPLGLQPSSMLWLAMPLLTFVVQAMWDDRAEGSGIVGALSAARRALFRVLSAIGWVLVVPMYVWLMLEGVGLLPRAPTALSLVASAVEVRASVPVCACVSAMGSAAS